MQVRRSFHNLTRHKYLRNYKRVSYSPKPIIFKQELLAETYTIQVLTKGSAKHDGRIPSRRIREGKGG